VGLASPAVRGEEDRELTFEVGDGATGSGTTTGALPVVSRQRHRGRWRRWCSVEGGGGAEGGKLGQPDAANQNFTTIRVSRQRGYSPYTRYVIGIG
jgi:hypothetical protein